MFSHHAKQSQHFSFFVLAPICIITHLIDVRFGTEESDLEHVLHYGTKFGGVGWGGGARVQDGKDSMVISDLLEEFLRMGTTRQFSGQRGHFSASSSVNGSETPKESSFLYSLVH